MAAALVGTLAVILLSLGGIMPVSRPMAAITASRPASRTLAWAGGDGSEASPDAATPGTGTAAPGTSERAIAAAPYLPIGVALGLYRPEFPADLSAVLAYEQAAGKRLTIIHWYALWGGWKSAFSRADLDAVATRGSVPMITWEPWDGSPTSPEWSLRSAVLSGEHDDYIASWTRGLAEYGRPVLLRFAHEAHDQPQYPWAVGANGNTAGEYIAAWKHVRAIFDRYGASNVQWVWNPNTLGDRRAAAYEAAYRALYPGDAYVDWLGLDVYNTGPDLDWGAPYWRTFDQVLAEPYQALTQVSTKPVLLAEVGSAEAGGTKAEWIADGLGSSLASRFPRVEAVVWFDVDKEEHWFIRSSQSAYAAFIAAWRSPQFLSGSAAFTHSWFRRSPESSAEPGNSS